MGFTNFLSRKPQQKQDDISSFKAQAYGSTTESLPPVLGTNPIPGNGINAIGSNGIHQLPRKKSRPQLPMSASRMSLRSSPASPAISTSSAAPAPLVPRLRSSSNLDRPNTAPNDPGPAFQSRPKSSGKTRSRRDSLRQTVGFLRNSGSHGDFHRAEVRDRYNDTTHAPPVPQIPAAHSPAPSGISRFPRSDTASLSLSATKSVSGSLNRGPGFVDILDAQGEIRPSDFRSRLQAAGARDYGEDVAERNMGINGVNLTSPAVTAYYATSSQSQQSAHGRQYNDLDILAQRPRTVNFPKRVDSYDKVMPVQRDSAYHARYRQDDRELKFLASKHGTAASTRPRPQPLKLQSTLSNSSSECAAEPPRIPRSRETCSSQKSGRIDKAPPSPRRARDSALLAGQMKWPLTAEHTSPTLLVPPRPHAFDRASHARERAIKAKTIGYDGHGRVIGELALESTADVDFVSAAPAPNIPSYFRPSDHPKAHMSNIDKARSKSAHGPRLDGRFCSPSRPSSSSSAQANAYPRTRSLGGLSLPPRPNLDDITEHIPPRTSSRRNWSISSSTPPVSGSDWSSDLFQRPHSRNTADTSNPPSASIKSLYLGRINDRIYVPHNTTDTELPTYYNIDENEAQSPAAHAAQILNSLIEGRGKDPARKNWSPHDDEFGLRISDNDDLSEQNPSQLEEESLLFRAGGYGNSGGGLPGLFEGRASPTPSDWSVQTMTYDQALDLITPGGLRPPNTPSQKTTFGSTLPTLPPFDTSSNDGDSDATSESGLDPKLDAKMAMKVRRELKRRTRVANIEKRHGKQPSYAVALAGQRQATSTTHLLHV